MAATDYFDKFADERFARDAGSVVGGVAAAQGGEILLDGTEIMGFSVPQELGGAATIVLAEMVPGVAGRVKRHVQLGGAVALLLALGERFGAHDAVMEVLG
ncbi:hypothetical protein [Haloparvum sedimenti]|uniref:hypothetical protein n=1 Tax=Haloparvum sedimenti TaxID=1678448 RepID=UPI00071E7B45|nr:hypothetical protein [Haloparvum sedimenti]